MEHRYAFCSVSLESLRVRWHGFWSWPVSEGKHQESSINHRSWWIHPIFAYHDGIISSPDPKGGITADSEGAYAITLTHIDNIDDKQSEFKYKIRNDDPGRFRLINNFLPVKAPIRVLRSHTLRSTYAPVAGIRYDGL